MTRRKILFHAAVNEKVCNKLPSLFCKDDFITAVVQFFIHSIPNLCRSYICVMLIEQLVCLASNSELKKGI